MHIESPAFANHTPIPQSFTCDGANVSPPLVIDASDAQAGALALLVDDPDSPSGTFGHWVLYNLPPDTRALPAGVTTNDLPAGTRVGTNGFGGLGWSGPCPRAGARTHRYVFTLFALEAPLPELGALHRDGLIAAMAGRVVARAQLTGTYALLTRDERPATS